MTLEDYLHVLRHVVEDDPFVVGNTLTVEISPEAGDISGDIFCHGGVIIDFLNYVEVTAYKRVIYCQIDKYSYHARYESRQDILRYDNAHLVDEQRTHHKHTWTNSGEAISYQDAWPHLTEVLRELRHLVWK